MLRRDIAAAAGAETMVFDWHKAAEIVRDNPHVTIAAGLRGDWGNTGGTIAESGVMVLDDYTYLASIHATPEIRVDGVSQPCFILESANPNNWNQSTKWPDSARAILNAR